MPPSYFHRGGETPLLDVTIDAWLRQVAAKHPDREAVVSVEQGTRLTYAELFEQVDALAEGLLALGIGRGTRVGIWSTDNAEWVVVQLATAAVGAVLVNINPAYRTGELRHALEFARVQALFLIPTFRSSNYVEMVRKVLPLPELEHLIVYDPANPAGTARPEGAFLTWGEVLQKKPSGSREKLDPHDAINIQFTSGTTGFPKPVVLTHYNILNNGYFVGEVMRFTPEDKLCVPLPFYHCFGMVVSTLATLSHGATLVIPSPHFEAGATLHAIQDERCTAVHGVPTMFIAELERPDFGNYDLSSLRTGIMAGAPCPPELVRRVMEDMHCQEILIGYGQTEASPVTHCTRPDDSFERRLGTVGTNLPHQEVKVIDVATAETVPMGEQGEVCFRGYHIMQGYFENEKATREAIDDGGWLHSGDLGVLNDDGYLQITGRLKDMIIRGGENIYPAEIESFYFDHPKVAEIAVFGVPDPKMGEEVGAWVRLHEGEQADANELREFARDRIAHFKIPRYLWIVDDFPMTVTGKIQKFKIQETVAEWLSKERGG